MGEAFGGEPAGDSGAVYGVGAAGLGEAIVKGWPVAGFGGVDELQWECDERVEKIVQLVFVAEVGPDFFADGSYGGWIDFAGPLGESAAEGSGAGAAFLDRKSTRLNSSHGGISRMPSSA